MVKSRQIFIISTCVFCSITTSEEIGTGLTCDSQYFEVYNSQYIEILCIYSQYLNIRFFPNLLTFNHEASEMSVFDQESELMILVCKPIFKLLLHI